ncbi:MAG TPA: class I SAM-dependent methyltransferase [Cyclobacteriaceae bacterium]|nr:class I SAM-dependent methyltransferase [Cyclobacteriaceae bacterium]
MELTTATALIERGVEKTSHPQTWADLGAGEGLFTNALSRLVAPQSTIYAIDRNERDLQQVEIADSIHLKKIPVDFVKEEIKMDPLDGVIMANALHFVKDSAVFLQKIKKIVKPSGRVIIVEYEMTTPNQWVPYPIGLRKMEALAKQAGLNTPIMLAEAQSVFNNRKIYSVLLR